MSRIKYLRACSELTTPHEPVKRSKKHSLKQQVIIRPENPATQVINQQVEGVKRKGETFVWKAGTSLPDPFEQKFDRGIPEQAADCGVEAPHVELDSTQITLNGTHPHFTLFMTLHDESTYSRKIYRENRHIEITTKLSEMIPGSVISFNGGLCKPAPHEIDS